MLFVLTLGTVEPLGGREGGGRGKGDTCLYLHQPAFPVVLPLSDVSILSPPQMLQPPDG